MKNMSKKLGPIHELHIFADGSFGDTRVFPGFNMGFKISGVGDPVSIVPVTPEIQKVLDSPDRHMYKWNHQTAKFEKHKKL